MRNMGRKMKRETEFEMFDRTMRNLMSVPHAEIRKKLDAEKVAKMQKKRKAKKPSASDRASGDKD